MTITAHAVTGSLVAVATGNIVFGVIAALVSHFVIDMIPHWDEGTQVTKRRYIPWMDLTLGAGLVLLLCTNLKVSSSLILAGAIAGVVPDLMWLPQVLQGKPSPYNKRSFLHTLRRIHTGIQTSETTSGIYVELGWVALMLVLIFANYL